MVIDHISDLLTRIRNAIGAKHRYVDVNCTKMTRKMVEVLKETGFIENFLVSDDKRGMRVFLKYSKEREPVIQGLKRVSKSGLRRYVGCEEIPRVLGGLGISILSTPRGVMEGKAAKKNRVGGELLCLVW